MGKRYRVRNRARAKGYSSFLFPFFTPQFAYVVTICDFEFCYKRVPYVSVVELQFVIGANLSELQTCGENGTLYVWYVRIP